MNQVRKELRRSLASIPEAATISDSIRSELIADLRAKSPKVIGIYAPISQWKEPSLLFLEDSFPNRCAFPRVGTSSDQKNEMRFYLAKSSELQESREIPGLREPNPESHVEVIPDFILAPATACDRSGHRIGKGGGYYDRYLHTHPECLAIGVVDDRCLFDTFAPEWVQTHDQPVAYILTQTQYFQTKETSS